MRTRWIVAPLLALSVIGASAAPRRPIPGRYPPLPDSVFSVFGNIKVTRAHNFACGPRPAGTVIGCYEGLIRRLTVDDSLDAAMAWRVFLHERAHLMFRDANVTFAQPEYEDQIANVIANYQTAELLSR